MSNVIINIQKGGLGRQSANTDTWGGKFVEVDTLPAGWVENEVKKIYKDTDLEAYGIKEDSVNDYYKLVFLHTSEFFRINANGTLFLQLATTTDDKHLPATVFEAFHNHNQANNVLNFAYISSSLKLTTANVESVQTEFNNLVPKIQPAFCIITLKADDVAGTIPDFSTASNFRCLVDVANDLTENGLAKAVFDSLGMCGAGGFLLGLSTLAKVHQEISWTKFIVNGGGRWQKIGDIFGLSVEDKTDTEIAAYGTQGVVLMKRIKRDSNVYVSSSRMAGKITDDYAILPHVRTINKAIVLAYDALLPRFNAPVYVNPKDGKLSVSTVSYLERLVYDAINNNMILDKAGDNVELSISNGNLPLESVYINPSQNVLVTENVNVELNLVPVGSSKTFTINIGLVPKLS